MSRPAVQLNTFSLNHAPGIVDSGFTFEQISPAINLVYGSNGSGKSTMARLIELLFSGQASRPSSPLARDSDVMVDFVFDQRRYRLHRRYDHVEAVCDGQRIDPPQLGPADHPDRYRLAMSDLFQSDGSAFARSVLDAMRGGYDVQAAADKLGLLGAGRLDASLTRPLEQARADYRQAVEKHDEVANQAEQLKDLQDEARRVTEAREQLPRLQALADWHTKREAADKARQQLEWFDPRIASLRLSDDPDIEDDRRIIDQFASREAALTQQCAQAQRSLDEAQQNRDTIALPSEGLAGEQLERWASLCDSVEDAEDQIARLDEQIAGEQGQAEGIRRRISDQVTDEQLDALDQAAQRQLGDFARLVGNYETKRQFIIERKRWLSEAESPAADSAVLDNGVVLLSQWLRAYGSGADWRAVIWPLGLVAGITVIITAALALIWAPVAWAAGLGGVAAMLGVTVWHLRRSDRIQASSRQTYQRDYASTGLPMPQAWNEPAVTAVLNDLMGRQQARALHDRQADLRSQLEQEDQELEQLKIELDRQREQLHQALGFAPSVDDHWLAGLVDQVGQWRNARNRLHRLQGSREQLLETQRSQARKLHEELNRYDQQPADGPEALKQDSLKQRLRALERRETQRRQADQAIRQHHQELDEAQEALDQCRRRYRAVFERVGVAEGDESTLRQLIDQQPAYVQAAQNNRDVQRDADQAQQRVADYRDMLDISADQLEQRRRELEAIIESGQDLHQRIGQITAQINAAKQGHDIADALRAMERARQELAHQRQRHIDAAVAKVLVNFVNRRTAEQTQPIVLKTARDLLGRFTEWRYELEVDSRQSDSDQFIARDTRDQLVKQLPELSAGERMQLLLAVRLAFVEAQESQARLPLLLDEVLGVSDDERTMAIIKAVIEIARAGRQVFYFTAQRDELAKWRRQLDEAGLNCAEHDLDALRGRRRIGELPLEVDTTPPPAVPAPEGAGRLDYARRIDVPGIDRWSDSQANLHLWHVMDDMDALYDLLNRRLAIWGPFEHYARRVGHSDSAVAAQYETLGSRVAVVRQACEAWRHGRAKPITRRQLTEAEGVTRSSKFEEAADLLEELAGDATQFIAALREGRISRLQSAMIDQTEQWLIDHGHIAGADPLDEQALVARIEAAATRQGLNRTTDRPFIERLIGQLGQPEHSGV